jgi:hypothetical protein
MTEATTEEETEFTELLSTETVCPDCWLAYHRNLSSCPNCKGW